jgi:hypothetical protein
MRLPIAVAGLFLSTALLGCGASATIPDPPSTPTVGPPPGTSSEMVKAPDNAASGGTLGAARPNTKAAGKSLGPPLGKPAAKPGLK